MELRQYIFLQRITAVQFAKQIGYDPSYIRAIAQGHVKPGRKFGRIVEEKTEGKVTMQDMMEAFEVRQQEKRELNGL